MYFKNQLTVNQGNTKVQWNTINTLLGRSRNLKASTESYPPCMDTTIAFNEQFLRNIFTTTNEETDFSKYLFNSPDFSMYLAPTNTNKVDEVRFLWI